MRLTTKGRFAVTAMIDLGLRQHHGPVTLAAISQRQQISLSYLEQLFGKLRRHALVESTRGPGGGYTLGRGAVDISVADIIYAVDEPLDATNCAGKGNCVNDQRCMTHDLWSSLNRVMVDYLDSVSLHDLVEKQKSSMLQAGMSLANLQDHRRGHRIAVAEKHVVMNSVQ
jgi:Rrf2 family transcriptional regulator, iron-sulfur cluster assembly transcription factor